MNDLKKCSSCDAYTLKDLCPVCSKKVSSAHYRFEKVRDAPPRSAPYKR